MYCINLFSSFLYFRGITKKQKCRFDALLRCTVVYFSLVSLYGGLSAMFSPQNNFPSDLNSSILVIPKNIYTFHLFCVVSFL